MQNFLKAVGPTQADGWTQETNIQELFFRLTIDSATEFLFGESVDSQLQEMPGVTTRKSGREKAFARNFDEAQAHMAKGFRLGDMYWMHNPKEFKENNRIVHEFVDYYVDLALKSQLNTEKKRPMIPSSYEHSFSTFYSQDGTRLQACYHGCFTSFCVTQKFTTNSDLSFSIILAHTKTLATSLSQHLRDANTYNTASMKP